MEKHFDIIIIGAGPAGSTAALKLAGAGLKVALLERGSHPGAKNMFGGLLHNTPALNEIIPSFWEQAPIERHVFKKVLSFMTETSSFAITLETDNFNETPYNGGTVFRPVFDNWLAGKAVAAGAELLCECTAENMVFQDGRATGVSIKSRDGELRSNIVIAADGVLSFMAKQAGLRQDFQAGNMGVGIKLLLGLPEEVINDRFHLTREEGADYNFVGTTEGLRGGSFLYTNRESVSIGMVVHIQSLKESGKKPYEVLNNILDQPYFRKLLKGAVPLEYSAHLIPEGGFQSIPQLYTGGMMVVGDAAGLCYTNGINLEGINLAMTSGALAAEIAIQAIGAKDYSAQMLSQYKKKLDDSFVIKDMSTFKNAAGMMHLERMFETYPELLCGIMEKMYRVEGIPRSRMLKLILNEARGKTKMTELIPDIIKMGRAML